MFLDYLRQLQAYGRLYFTIEEAMKDLGTSKGVIYAAVKRQKQKGKIISPVKGLYIIVPDEYYALGCLPPDQLVPILMKHLKVNYYTGLLTAALYHGASHQKPGVFQIVSDKQFTKNLRFGQVSIDFVYKRSLEDLPTQTRTVDTGLLQLSTPEVTAMDLFLYLHQSGGINHSATVLSELVEVIDPEKLLTLAKNSSQHAWIQRMGYVLEHIDSLVPEHQKKVIDVLANYVASQNYTYIPLSPSLPTKGSPRSEKWKIIENKVVESDL